MNIIVWHNGVANPWGSQGASGIQNSLKDRTVTLDDILDAINKCCKILTDQINLAISIGNTNHTLLNTLLECCKSHDEKFDAVFSAILDLRRELLRGNRDIRR